MGLVQVLGVSEAKDTLPRLVRDADQGPVFIGRHRKAVAVLVSVTEYERLLAAAGEGSSGERRRADESGLPVGSSGRRTR